jgi:hypothetical protein
MKRLTHTPAFFFITMFFMALTSCTSVETLVEGGNYEETIRLAQKRLTGKQKKNPKFVLALETAFNRVTEADMDRARRKANSGNPDWASIQSIYKKIQRRQDALSPLLPLVDKRGYQAEFRFARVDGLIADAGDKAAAQIYQEGVDLLALARQGEKSAGRSAFAAFDRVGNYRANYRDANNLMAEARELGKVYVAIEMVNRSGGFLPAGFERELLRPGVRNLDDNWRFYDFTPVPGKTYDYNARILIDAINVSPERISQRAYTDEKEITDGTEYVLDANGNVAKDTLGNDITRPRLILVRANVIEILQTKTAVVSGSLVLYDNRERRVVDEERLTAEARFENYASTYRGDRRAISSNTRRNLGTRPVGFPSNEALILDAADVLKPQLQERLAYSSRVI